MASQGFCERAFGLQTDDRGPPARTVEIDRQLDERFFGAADVEIGDSERDRYRSLELMLERVHPAIH